MQQEIENFASIQQLRKADKGTDDNEKIRQLSGVTLVIAGNDYYLKQGNNLLLCDLVSNVQISRGELDVPTVRWGPLDVIGKYISESYIDEGSHFRVERIIRYD